MSLPIPVCSACGTATYPAPLLCPSCAASSWRFEPAETGVLEGCTVTARNGLSVGLVRVPSGPLAVVRVEGGPQAGDEVALSQDGLVPVARPV